MNRIVSLLHEHYKLLIKCSTYNHSKYIVNSLSGFAAQRTEFDYLCYVVDDASTDGEQEVILEWLGKNCDMDTAKTIDSPQTKIICVSPIKNNRCLFIINLLKINMYGNPEKFKFVKPLQERVEYVALCEGDDYWTNSTKLQRQVEYLDSNEQCSLCFHNAIVHYDGANKILDHHFAEIEERDYDGIEFYEKRIIPTASVVFRRRILENEYYLNLSKNKNFAYGDMILFVSSAELGSIHGMPEVMSVYTKHEGSFSYTVPMLLHCKNDYEMYMTVGGEYASIAKRLLFSTAIPQIYLNIFDANVRDKCFSYCWRVDPLLTIWKLIVFPIAFLVDKVSK